MSLYDSLELALKLSSIAHFMILVASLQVPIRLNWRSDLLKLTPFNRKLMWTYGSFTVLTIVCFGVMTAMLRHEMLEGDRAALALSFFIGIYWGARVAVDAFYFNHSDWPDGKRFILGHILLTSTFVLLSLTHLGLVLWHVKR